MCYGLFKRLVSRQLMLHPRHPPRAILALVLELSYGGFGGRVNVQATPVLGIMFGGGYNLAGFGYNVGLNARLSPDKRVVPVLLAMYGYNAVIRVTGSLDVREIYYGPSFGAGVQFKSRKNPKNFFNMELLVPMRPSEYENDLNALKSIGIQFTEPLPVSFSFGYHIGF
ncbi:MAG: hypothetical protein ACK576_07085 [Cyclobacteriaceae bacterium]